MKAITTIKLEQETKARLERLKEHERETYNQVIKKVLYILNRIRKDPVSANRVLGSIDKNIKRIQKQEKFKEQELREERKEGAMEKETKNN